MATQGQVSAIKNQLGRLVFEPAQLIHQPQHLGISFEVAAENLRKLDQLVSFLSNAPLDYVLEGSANEVTARLTEVATVVEGIRKYNGNAGPGQRDSLVTSLHQSTWQLLATVSPSLSLLLLPDIGTASGALLREAQNARRSVQEAASEVQAAAASAREAAAAAGAAAFSEEFAVEARALEEGATRWLAAAAVFALLTVAVAGCFAFNVFSAHGPALDPSGGAVAGSSLVQTMGGKLVILSMLLTAATWCGRNYKAQRHLAILNRHRALSLRTFQAFSAAASDEVTKNAVLMEATRAIFSAGATGYVGGKDGSDESTLRIVEIAKGLGSKSSSP